MDSDAICQEILDSDLKGRGGAGFPTGMKWKITANEKDPIKYIVCNADEGEPGTFEDREILDQVPGKVFSPAAASPVRRRTRCTRASTR